MSTKLSIPLDIPNLEILDIKLNKKGEYLITVESTLDHTHCRQCGRKITQCISHD